MNEYVVKKVNTKDYDRFLLCLTFESLLSYLDSIESSPLIIEESGNILIDQLLVTGNGDNRFISCKFQHGKLDFATAHAVQPDEYFREITTKWLNNHYCYVEHSILTEHQRHCIKAGIVF